MDETKQVVAAYCAAWNEPDEQARRALLEQAWALDGDGQLCKIIGFFGPLATR